MATKPLFKTLECEHCGEETLHILISWGIEGYHCLHSEPANQTYTPELEARHP